MTSLPTAKTLTRFKVRAAHLDGSEYVDTIEAVSASELSEQLRAQGYSVTSISAHTPRPKRRVLTGNRTRAIASASRQLSLYLEAGAALPAALRGVARHLGQPAFEEALQDAAARIEAGESLHAALAAQPRHFPPLFRFIAEAGCASGRLGPALLLVSQYYETAASLRHRLIEAAIYPSVLAVVMLALVLEAAYFVVPRFMLIYADLEVPLPEPTRMALYAVEHTGEWLPWMCAILATVLVTCRVLAQVPCLRLVADRAVLWTPFLGGLIRAYVTAKFSAGLSLLLESRVPAPDAIRLLADMEPNRWVRHSLHELAQRTDQGETVSDAMARAPASLLPKTFLWVVGAADGTAQLGAAVKLMGELYEDVAKRRFGLIEALLVPAVVLIMGALTLFMAAVLLLPLLESLEML